MNNAVIYGRYSDEKQSEQSIEGQLRVCYEYAERCGLNVITEYIDRAMTGKYDDRPQFQQMLSDAKKKQFQFIIVYKLDRFARNRYDSAIHKHTLKQYNVKVVSAMENIGMNDTPETILLEAMLEASAEYYSVDLSQKVRRGLKESALKANSCGGTIPLGYKIENKKMVVDDSTSPIIKFIFNEYANGVGKKEIANKLNEKGYRNSRGNLFNINSFRQILSNKKYIGIYTYNDIVVDGGCPAIISTELFEKCQKQLKATKRKPAVAKAKVEYLLTGKAFCGMCGKPFVGESGRSSTGVIYNYYTCSKRKKEKACNKKNEKKDFLEWYVTEQTILYVLNNDRINFIADRMVELYNNEFNTDNIKNAEKELKKTDRELTTTIESLIKTSNQTAIDYINEKLSVLELRKNNLQLEIAKLKIAAKVKLNKDDIIKWLKNFCKGDLMDLESRKRIIDTLVNAIYIYDDKIVIYYNVKDSKQISYIEMLESSELEDLEPISNSSDLKRNGSPKKPLE